MTTPAAPPPGAIARIDPAVQFNELKHLLKKSEASLAAALPSFIPPNYMIRTVLTMVQRTPALLECYPLSVLGAVFQAAQLGLIPDGVLGQAYLVPYRNTKKNRKEAQFIPGYRGLIELVRRSGQLSTIDADVVHAKDKFEYERGTEPRLSHTPYEPKDAKDDAGPIVKVWATAKLKDGGYQIHVMTMAQVEKIKQRSSAVKGGHDSPWNTDPEWMIKKTCLKQLCKLLPVSVETQQAIALDDKAEVNLPQDLAMLADPNEEATILEGETTEEPPRAAQRRSEQTETKAPEPETKPAPAVTPASAVETKPPVAETHRPQSSHPIGTAEDSRTPAMKTIGQVVNLEAKGSAFVATLSTGFKCSTRNGEFIVRLRELGASEKRVELRCIASSNPAKYLPTLEEIVPQ